MQAWTIVRKAGYIPDSMSLEHHMFGMMLGKMGVHLKRARVAVRLTDLLDEAHEKSININSWKILIWMKRN